MPRKQQLQQSNDSAPSWLLKFLQSQEDHRSQQEEERRQQEENADSKKKKADSKRNYEDKRNRLEEEKILNALSKLS